MFVGWTETLAQQPLGQEGGLPSDDPKLARMQACDAKAGSGGAWGYVDTHRLNHCPISHVAFTHPASGLKAQVQLTFVDPSTVLIDVRFLS